MADVNAAGGAGRGAHLHQCRSQAVLLAALSVSISVMKRLNR